MQLKLLFSLSFLMMCFLNSCTQENNDEISTSKLKELYEKLETCPYNSIFSINYGTSRAEHTSDYIYFAVTNDDIEYLSSLSQDEMKEERERLIQSLGHSGENIIDSLQSVGYEHIFNVLGGHVGMNQLINFTTTYIENIESTEKWDEISQLIPSNLTENQANIYIYMAVCVNKICRPIYRVLTTRQIQNISTTSRNARNICDAQLAAELSIMGIDLTAEAFIDIMSGGAMTAFEATVGCANLVGIWYNYETCNGRWH